MPASGFLAQLRECCLLTDASWAVWLQQDGPNWAAREYHGLNRASLGALLGMVEDSAVCGWLERTLVSGRVRSRSAADSALACSRVYAIPAGKGDSVLLVGAQSLNSRGERIWRLAALSVGQLRRHRMLEQDLRNTKQELQARIAAQAAAEQRLIQAAKLAAVGEMAAGVAHELNNPLTTIVGFAELIRDDLPQGSTSRTDIDTVLREAMRARDVVRHLLDFSRSSEMVRVKADINALTSDSLALVRHLLSTNGVQVRANLDDTLPWGFVDRDQIKQVLLNLIHNALNAMPSGGEIAITTSCRQKYGSNWITITLADTGVGIPPENMLRIFEPFFTTRSGEGGTGLGLSVTYGIVASHGGRIEVESVRGEGASFTVWLPVEAQGA